ncbi:hypothetical protein CVT26_003464 [Gymnopilus dilepis]|uniref:F-box domain-containing protein n=1 Tax=Gymnopilus dilepis TaxID=231916 RepID=A0A409Y5H5_9AGAR|nr:hypothetical protein CVT26_003464 [Gymnopilus dilepis]
MANASLLDGISSLRKPFSQPPPEIIHMIFERTVPPYFLLDSSASFCLNPIWCKVQKQKKAIVEVCRPWYNVGLPFLWEDIVILRVQELRSLLFVLKDSPHRLRHLVKRVEIHCYIPFWYAAHFTQQLQQLFAVCPRISSCSYLSQCLPPPLIHSALENATTITQLCLSNGLSMEILGPLLRSLSPFLVSLSFHVPPELIQNFSELPKCHLRVLKELTIWVGHAASNNLDSLSLHRWFEIPHLKQLTFCLGPERTHHTPDVALRRFCQEYGARLSFLQIHSTMLWNDFTNSQALLELCPVLEHLVIYGGLFRNSDAIYHPNIRWLDVWFNDIEQKYDQELNLRLNDLVNNKFSLSKFPLLKGVRLLQHTYAFPYNLPLMLPPDLVSNVEDRLRVAFLDFEMRHDLGKVYFVSNDWVSAMGSNAYSKEPDSMELDSDDDGYDEESESAWSPSSGYDTDAGAFSDTDSSLVASEDDSESNGQEDMDLDALEMDIPIFD